MALYRDDQLLLDPRHLVLAYKIDGDGPHDGVYILVVHLAIGEEVMDAHVAYVTQQERDTAFTAISRLRAAVDLESFNTEDTDTL